MGRGCDFAMSPRVRQKMRAFNLKGFAWRTGLAIALLLDYFLFSTGNPSVTYCLLGGWFEIVLGALLVLTIEYTFKALKGREPKQHFFAFLGAVVASGVILMATSGLARDFAASSMEERVLQFMRDPVGAEAESSQQEKALAASIGKRKYLLHRETFIPTFRRIDYLLVLDDGEKYRLVMTMSWRGISEVSIRKVSA